MTAEPPLSIALLTYSTRPRGGVVHTLALAEALAAGQQVTVWTLGRGGDRGFFRPVAPAVRLRVVPFPDAEGESVGERILRSIADLRGVQLRWLRHRACAGLHQRRPSLPLPAHRSPH
jgi:hypothetical protein